MHVTSSKLKKYLRALQPRRLVARFTGPRVLLASVPKAGTNLLIRVLELFPHPIPSGTAVGVVSQQPELLPKIAAVKRGRFIVTHCAFGDVASVVEAQDMLGVFLIRDPRDTCVSWYHYIMREPAHWCHSYFCSVLSDRASRLMAAIRGLTKDPRSEHPFLASIDEHFRLRMGYMDEARFCTVRFEDLVGSAGGGNDNQQAQTLHVIANHLGLRLTSSDIRRITTQAFCRESPTFRKGQIGSWRDEMGPAHRAAFKEVAGPLLIELGYESTLSW